MLGSCVTCRLQQRIQRCLGCIVETWPIKSIQRILPLLTSSWMIVDIGLDVKQTITYYNLIEGFAVDGKYHNWALKYMNETNAARLQTVSTGYFYTACAVWTIPPLVLSFITPCGKGLMFPKVFNTIFRCKIEDNKNGLIFYPIELISCILFIYILIPFAALKNGIKHLVDGEVDVEEELIVLIRPKELPYAKLFEVVGEALPQFILTAVFAANNFPFLQEFDTYLNIPIPVSIVSLVFSLGSLIIGVISGFKSVGQGGLGG